MNLMYNFGYRQSYIWNDPYDHTNFLKVECIAYGNDFHINPKQILGDPLSANHERYRRNYEGKYL